MANERIKIFELNIDVDGAIKESEKLKKETSDLKTQLKELKDAGKENTAEFVQVEAQYKNLNREYNASQRQLGNLISLQDKNIETVQEARAALSVVSREWAKQAAAYGANSKEADELAKKKLELTETLKTLEKSTGDTSRNVGNYTESMKEAIQQSGLWQKAQSAVNDVNRTAGPIITFISAQIDGTANAYREASAEAATYTGLKKALAVATNAGAAALRVFKVALVSTGIGAIIVLLGSLVAWMAKTQDGIDFVNKALAALSGGFDVVIQRVAQFGRALADFLSGNFKAGIDGMSDAFKGMGTEIRVTIGLALELEKVMQAVNKEEVNLDIRRAAANARLKELNKTIEDVTKTEEERLAAAREYQRLDEELTNQEVANQERRVAAMLGFHEVTDEVRETIRRIGEEGVSLDQLGIGESTLEDAKELRDEVSKLYDLQTQSAERQTTNQNKLNTIQQQVRAQELKAEQERIAAAEKAHQEWLQRQQERTDAALKESNLRLQIFVEENKGRAKTLEESLEYEKEIYDRRQELLEDQLEAGKVSQTEYELERLKIKNEYLAQQEALTTEYANKEIEAEKERLAQMQELEAQERERKATDLENRMIAEEENFLAQMEIERQRLEMQRQMEIEEAEKTGASIALINQKYAKINEQIDYELNMARRDHYQHTFGEIAKLLGEQTVAGKAAAIAQATINTYQGVTEVWRSPSVLPEPFATIQKLVSTGTVLASGLGAVANIKSTNANIPKAAKGATLQGPSHAAGGVKLFDQYGNPVVEAEGGENVVVLNKRASGLMNSLSSLNMATGGIPLTQHTSYAAAGGMIRTSPVIRGANNQQAIDYDVLAQKIAQANMNLPAPQVSVEEINMGQNQNARVINGAIL